MSFNALWIVLAALLVVTLWLFLRKPKPKPRSNAPRTVSPVSRPNAKGAESAELPVFESETVAAPVEARRPLPDELRGFHLIMQSEMDDAARERIKSICTNMPEPHPVQRQLANGLDTPDDLMEAVASDAGLTASILRTVNSAAFSLASPITSVQHAITYLGVSVVKGLVAQAAVAEQVDDVTPSQQAALSRIWKSACTASALAQMLGQELGVERPSVLATKALFFNLGDVALAMSIEESAAWYKDGVSIVERVAAQQQACSANAAIVGSMLADLWHLPQDIVDAIESGLLPLVTTAADHPMQGDARRDNVLVYLAGRIGDRVTYRGLRDIAELNVVDSEESGLFYLPEHLNGAGLGRIPQLLQDPAFRRKANRALATLNG
ncbi:putative signal transduction protein [gamma proteobacterium NOR5-3]|nr:putative signal transduction protein [gamma proteobacterium NOR5-3]